MTILARHELMEETTHHGQSSELFLTIIQIMDSIRLIVDAIIMTL